MLRTGPLVVLLLFLAALVATTALQNKYCPLACDYGVKIVTHTVCERADEKCGPHPRCGADFKIVRLTNHQRQYIVDLHNYLRNKVAVGNETRGRQPPAANMNLLTYNKELEFISQCWANTCQGHPLIHDTCRRTAEFEHVGQNLANIDSSAPITGLLPQIKKLIMLWYDEVALFKNDWVLDTQDRGPNYKVGHYTQMLWADTTEIGCALSSYTMNSTNHKYVVLLACNYGIGGNYIGLPLYQAGRPASNCPPNRKANKHYRGLCGAHKSIVTQPQENFDIFA